MVVSVVGFGWRLGVGDKAFIVVERNGSVAITVVSLIMRW